ncbi:protein yippee-like [Hibiscus syriacus]|uniref:Protein yippee-like n=1 Tax=Hibiscus syriacus TaxID=106335 RepID=A0A6A2ZDT0_HIBSY|nr:protein yippee-like [Hibiscus syriacus]
MKNMAAVSASVYLAIILVITERRKASSLADSRSFCVSNLITNMIIPEKNRREISKYLFQEGVCYAKKDYNLASTRKSMFQISSNKVDAKLQIEGIVRETLLGCIIMKQTRPGGRPMGPSDSRPRGPPRFGDGERRFGDRDGYRGGPRGGGDFGDKGGAPADYQPSFRGPGSGLLWSRRRWLWWCGSAGAAGIP